MKANPYALCFRVCAYEPACSAPPLYENEPRIGAYYKKIYIIFLESEMLIVLLQFYLCLYFF